MNRLDRHELKNLLQVKNPPCISLYIPIESQENDYDINTCYKNLLFNTEILLKKSYSEETANNLLGDLKKINPHDLLHLKNGTLVIFKSRNINGFVVIPRSLPGLSIVADSFHIKPAIELLLPLNDFYVLSLESDSATLFKGNALEFQAIRNFEINDHESYERLSLLPKQAVPFFGAMERFILSIGFKLKDSIGEALRQKFYDSIDTHVRALVANNKIPLILAAKPIDVARYTLVNTCPLLRRGYIKYPLNIEDSHQIEFAHAHARIIAGTFYKEQRLKSIAAMKHANKKGNLKSGINSVVKELSQNNVETLFIRRHEIIWGNIDWKNAKAQIHPYQLNGTDDDILDDSIEKAISLGAKVVLLEKHEAPLLGPILAITKDKEERRRDTFIYKPKFNRTQTSPLAAYP